MVQTPAKLSGIESPIKFDEEKYIDLDELSKLSIEQLLMVLSDQVQYLLINGVPAQRIVSPEKRSEEYVKQDSTTSPDVKRLKNKFSSKKKLKIKELYTPL